MEKIKEILNTTCWGNGISDYCVALIIILSGILLVWVIDKVVVIRIKKKVKETKTTIDDFLIIGVEKALVPILYVGVVYFALSRLALSASISRYVDILGIILVTIFGLRFFARLANYVVENIWLMREKDPSKTKNIKGVLILVKAFIWGIGIILLLDNLGYKVSAVLAGLGIGGIAVALAAQAVLGDLFSYVSILFDRPFEVGDFIIIGDYMGTVENIGIKTTRIRSLSGEEIIFSNSDLTGSRVKNFKRMQSRRVLFGIGVTYDTPKEKLEKIPSIIRNIIESVENTTFDRTHFASYGDFSLNFEIVYYVGDRDYNKYMDIQQEINLKIYEAFEKEKIEFAFPTQTVHVNKDV